MRYIIIPLFFLFLSLSVTAQDLRISDSWLGIGTLHTPHKPYYAEMHVLTPVGQNFSLGLRTAVSSFSTYRVGAGFSYRLLQIKKLSISAGLEYYFDREKFEFNEFVRKQRYLELHVDIGYEFTPKSMFKIGVSWSGYDRPFNESYAIDIMRVGYYFRPWK